MKGLSQRTLTQLLDTAPIAVLAFDREGAVIVANAAAKELFGFHDDDQLLGTSVTTMIPAIESLKRSRNQIIEIEATRSDGTLFSAALALSRVESENGPLFSATIRDVTERKEVDAEARRAKTEAERVRLEVESDRISAEGERDEAERVRLEAERVRLNAENEKSVAEYERVKAEGEKIVAENLRTDAEREKALAEDVRIEALADRERLEVQLHQSQRLESLGQLAGGVAHDFNNLLAVILNYASFVADELSTASTGPEGEKWNSTLKDVEQIQLAAERASLLTHQLLSFARREVVQAQALSLNSAITRMEQILRRTIGEQIHLVINLSDDLPLVVADPGQIEQIILNLAINARDAMPSGGTLSIDTSVQVIDAEVLASPGVPKGSYVSCRVSDNGTGMSAEVRDKAYEPFFTTKPRGEGSGLGLATVYGIVSQSGGHIEIHSDEGIGTSITILLPQGAQSAPQRVVEESAIGASSTSGVGTVLVVDDENALREVTRRILTRHGYSVVTASSGAQAIELARSYEGVIDLLLTDVIMPVMQGPTVASEVMKLRPGIRVLFMSGHALPVLESEMILGTEFQLVEKPFDQTTLLENVHRALTRRAVLT